jgi:hypothetical protein
MKKFLTILVIIIGLNGCDLFQVRDAEQPEQPRDNYQLATTPQILINNLISSLADKSVENYLACFADSSFSNKRFTFFPSAGAVSQYPFFNEWSLQQEMQYFNRMKTSIRTDYPITLTINNVSQSSYGDSLIYTAAYSLNVPHDDVGMSANYQGDLRFSMSVDSRLVWTIYFWQDTKGGNSPSWSELKGRYY